MFVKLFPALLFFCMLSFGACRKDDCQNHNLDIIAKADALNSSYSLSDCLAYQAALYNYIEADCQGSAKIEADLIAFNCPQ